MVWALALALALYGTSTPSADGEKRKWYSGITTETKRGSLPSLPRPPSTQ